MSLKGALHSLTMVVASITAVVAVALPCTILVIGRVFLMISEDLEIKTGCWVSVTVVADAPSRQGITVETYS